MDWWQIVLIILLFIVAGLVVGYVLGYLIITRILRKPFVMFPVRTREGAAVAGEAPKFALSSIFSIVAGIRDIIVPQAKGRVATEAEEQTGQETVIVDETQ